VTASPTGVSKKKWRAQGFLQLPCSPSDLIGQVRRCDVRVMLARPGVLQWTGPSGSVAFVFELFFFWLSHRIKI